MDSQVEQEYKIAKTKGFWLLDFSIIEVSGNNRVSFLHRMLTQDIKSLRVGNCAPSAFLNAQGKVLALFEILALENKFLIFIDTSDPSCFIHDLDKFIVADDVTLKNVSPDWNLIQLSSEDPKSSEPFHPFLNRGFYDQQSCMILIEKEKENSIREQLIKAGFKKYGREAAEILRIENTIPRFGKDVDASITLPESGLDKMAASETKGCYPGQEVVARTNTYNGHAKKLFKIEFETGKNVTEGNKICLEEKEIGWVTSATDIPESNRGTGLAYILKGNFDLKQAAIQTSQAKISTKLHNFF